MAQSSNRIGSALTVLVILTGVLSDGLTASARTGNSATSAEEALRTPIDVGGRKQLFIDDRFVESPEGVTLRAHTAAKAEMVLEPVAPDEQRMMWIASIVEAEEGYYLYYTTWLDASEENGLSDPLLIMRVAASDDGLTWRRVPVGLIDIGTGTDNNIVMAGTMGRVFVDPHETEGYRYWMLGHLIHNHFWEESRHAPTEPGHTDIHRNNLYLCRSKDGLHWEAVPEPPFPFTGDTTNQALYDPRIGTYVCYLRARPGGHGSRAVARGQSDSLLGTWPYTPDPYTHRRPREQRAWLMTELPLVMQIDEFDPPLFGLYSPSVIVYPWADDAYFTFTEGYRRRDGIASHGRDRRGQPGNEGPLAPELAVSRDGIDWYRFRGSYVPLGRIGQVDGGTIYMGVGMIRNGDEIWQYCTVSPHTHHGFAVQLPGSEGGIRRHIQRLDGFVSLDAGLIDGTFRTPPIVFEGDRLELNVDCGARGEVWVEIQDADGRPVEGFTMHEAVSVDRNGVAEPVWWKNGPDVSPLAGKPVRLAFRMRSASLFAFQFVKE